MKDIKYKIMVHYYLYNAGYEKWITKKEGSNIVPGKFLMQNKEEDSN
jgi:hypothetical protein